jgi:hypothetical protein
MNAVALFRRGSSELAPIERRANIVKLEEKMKALPECLVAKDYVTRHHFAPGQYAREIELPKGGIVVGKIHKHAHINVLSAGIVRVYTEGEGSVKIVAPATFVSTPGTKRVVKAVTDAVWTTVHVTDSTDLAEIEREIIAPTFDDLPVVLDAEYTEV